MEARINHRVTQKAKNYGVACHRKFSTILSRLDGFQIQSSGERFIAILLKFYRVKFKGKKLPQRVIFNDIFNVRARRHERPLFCPTLSTNLYFKESSLLPSAPIYIHAKTRDLFDSIYSSNSPVKSR